jgi:ATP-binding cassette subfamily C (CFTR/MRP) protein 1
VQHFPGFLGGALTRVALQVQYLPLADNIIVLDTTGSITEQGTFDYLRSQGGFISKILIHPEILQRDSTAGTGEGTKPKTSPTFFQASSGARAGDAEDLTRRIGDLSVYKYWLSSVGWKYAISCSSCSLIFNLASTFPCKLSYSFNWNRVSHYIALWLNWYSGGTFTSLSLFASIYALSAVIALTTATVTV